MNFLNLKYFCVVAEELSFTRAAQKLFISQQSLSLHISKLEDEFGMVLFNRTQPLTLTEAGRCLYQHSKQLLSEKRIVEKAMQEGWSTASDEIRSQGFGAGMGLPNMKKYTDRMQIDTVLGVGTAITLRIDLH